jgi:hypothetical protein
MSPLKERKTRTKVGEEDERQERISNGNVEKREKKALRFGEKNIKNIERERGGEKMYKIIVKEERASDRGDRVSSSSLINSISLISIKLFVNW